MLVSELAEGYAVQVGNPEDRIAPVIVNGKPALALLAEISVRPALGPFFDNVSALTLDAVMLIVFLS